MNIRFKFMLADTPEQHAARKFSIESMSEKLNHDERLIKLMIPDFAVGCRRPTPGAGFLEALTQDNVSVITDEIVEVLPEGIKTATGEIQAVDALICATGFDVSFQPRFPIHGRDGQTLSEVWKKVPEAYMSLAASHMPNHFRKKDYYCEYMLIFSLPWTQFSFCSGFFITFYGGCW